jgi:hypothetical protein
MYPLPFINSQLILTERTKTHPAPVGHTREQGWVSCTVRFTL